MFWDNLFSIANKAETRTKTQESIHLDQQWLMLKQPLKISLNSQDKQPIKKSKKKGQKT